MTTYIYDRRLRKTESTEPHIREARELYPDAVFVRDDYDPDGNRPEWSTLEKNLESGDTLVAYDILRLFTSADEANETYRDLLRKGVDIVLIDSPHLNSDIVNDASRAAVKEILRDIPANTIASDSVTSAISLCVNRIVAETIRRSWERTWQRRENHRNNIRNGIAQTKNAAKKTRAEKAKDIIRTHAKRYGGDMTADQCAQMAEISRNTYFRYCRAIDTESQDTLPPVPDDD